MSSGLFKNNITNKLFAFKQDLVLNNPQGLICHKTQPNQTKNYKQYIEIKRLHINPWALFDVKFCIYIYASVCKWLNISIWPIDWTLKGTITGCNGNEGGLHILQSPKIGVSSSDGLLPHSGYWLEKRCYPTPEVIIIIIMSCR